MNSKPDKGQPCLTPLFRANGSEAKPLFSIQLEMFVYRVLIQVLKSNPNLKESRTLNRYSHSKLSNAFSKSINEAIPSISWSMVK